MAQFNGYPDLQNAANKLNAERKAAIAAVRADRRLTPQGQAEQVQRIHADYESGVIGLQRSAQVRIANATADNTLALRKARAAAFDAKRAVLGDVVVAQLYLQRLSAQPSDVILREYESAADGFEKVLIAEIGRTILAGRIQQENASAVDFETANAFYSVAPEQRRLRELEAESLELENSERFVQGLDVAASQAQLADAFGVNVNYME